MWTHLRGACRRGCLAVAVAGCVLPAPALAAQEPASAPPGLNAVFAGSETERYLRLLQVGGRAELFPWTVRGLSMAQVDGLVRDSLSHPWQARHPISPDTAGGFRYEVLDPELQLRYNSAIPFGFDDGPVWAGRGATAALRFGVAARYRGLSVTLAPVAFRAENREFELEPTNVSEDNPFADKRTGGIDLPQRFGDGAYSALHPGESSVRLSGRWAAAGFSTGNQVWGPAAHHPIILGTNAPGFPHVFLESSRPLNVGVGRVHGRIVWGRLSDSDYSLAPDEYSARLMSGGVVALVPRGLPGLELGLARFLHSPWPSGGIGLDELLRPFAGIWKRNYAPTDEQGALQGENQLASAFARWVAPNGGFELYGEFGREDHSWDLRDFLVEPDHNSAYMLGASRVVWLSGTRFVAVRGEVLNSRVSHLSRVRQQGPLYFHTGLRGHTQRGQLLGSPSGYGGGGAVLTGDYYHPGGRWTVTLRRDLRDHRVEAPILSGTDAMYSGGAEVLLFRRGFDLLAGATLVYNRNRNFTTNVTNGSIVLGVRADL